MPNGPVSDAARATADDLMARKRYRDAFHKSAQALKYDPENQEAGRRQLDAKRFGTKNFVILPFIHDRPAENLTIEINSEFNNGPARNMPPFTALVREFDVQDAIRAIRANPQRITRNQAVAIARRTNADFVVFREITFYRHGARYTNGRTEKVNRVGEPPTATTIEVRKGKYELKSTVRFSIIDAQTGHSIYSEEAKIDSEFDFEQAFLKEPAENLKLSNKQRSLLIPPGNGQDIHNLEKASAKNATEVFIKTVLPKMEELVP